MDQTTLKKGTDYIKKGTGFSFLVNLVNSNQ